MSTEAIIMMLVSMAVVWGGLFLAALNLSRSSTAVPDDEHAPER